MSVSDLAQCAIELRDRFHSSIDLGSGVNTRPAHVQRRFQRRLRLLQIPEDLTGKTVLDVGAWDGYWSFEFERRGAKRVFAVDTWTGPQGLETFLLARERFKSEVEHERVDVHDLIRIAGSPDRFNASGDIASLGTGR